VALRHVDERVIERLTRSEGGGENVKVQGYSSLQCPTFSPHLTPKEYTGVIHEAMVATVYK